MQVDGLIHSGGTKYHELAAGTDNEGVAISKDSKCCMISWVLIPSI